MKFPTSHTLYRTFSVGWPANNVWAFESRWVICYLDPLTRPEINFENSSSICRKVIEFSELHFNLLLRKTLLHYMWWRCYFDFADLFVCWKCTGELYSLSMSGGSNSAKQPSMRGTPMSIKNMTVEFSGGSKRLPSWIMLLSCNSLLGLRHQ